MDSATSTNDSPSEFQAESVLKKLDSWIIDENKLVTYKWLSRTSQISVNQAKWILAKFIEHRGNKPLPEIISMQEQRNELISNNFINQEKHDLTVTYCLSGIKKDSGAFKIEIVRENDLELRIASFVEPVSCHVYAVQKGTGAIGSHTLYIADCDITKDNLLKSNAFSTIICDKAILRSVEQLKLEKKLESAIETTKSKPIDNAKSSENKAVSFFGNAKPSSTTAINNKTTSNPSKSSTSSEKPSASFFGRQTDKPKLAVAVKDESEKDSISSKSKENHSTSTDKHQGKNTASASNKNSTKIPPEKSKPKTSSGDSKLLSNKRRRVLDLSSSEDEVDAEEEEKERRNLESMDVENCDPQQNSDSIPESTASESQESVVTDKYESGIKATKTENGFKDTKTENGIEETKPSATLSQTNRRLVSKTYQNEDGFIVTEKVWETVSMPVYDAIDGATNGEKNSSANENFKKDAVASETQGAVKKPVASIAATSGKGAKKGGKATNVGGKQQSMMTFFKKQ